MLSYEKKAGSNVAEIVVDGKISDEEMNAVMTAMKADLEGGGKIKLLEDIRSFQGMEPAAFFKDPRIGLSMMKGVSHVALVTDATWLKALAETFSFVSPAQIKVFERARLDEARSWLAGAA
ncbi:STAS/SEC14 domain-containing protein [Methylobacterium durans]|uniref:STAS/SEC14 domain-containing protein n=1 Tax=Methylobacterium durans TaxID=2202825 RepID=A0A2U8W3Z9_9HYPH|nr:STAS/SEC14 domain-containing protein [Methylobacterium durans]AWN40368.1 STAS/SEC14 domain-containing protein [Methylobacterium durans]